MDDATFTFGDPFRGEDARLAVRYMARALTTTTVGDLYIGQVYRSRIREAHPGWHRCKRSELHPVLHQGAVLLLPQP